MAGRILLVDDDSGVLRALARVLRRAGYDVTAHDDAATALPNCRDDRFDIVISDFRMPGMNGIQFLNEVRVCCPGTVRVILSGEADRDAILASINEVGVFRFLTKPWDEQVLLESVAEAIAQRHADREAAVALEFHRNETDRDYRRKRILDDLEQDSPGITSVNWSENQTIIIDDGEL